MLVLYSRNQTFDVSRCVNCTRNHSSVDSEKLTTFALVKFQKSSRVRGKFLNKLSIMPARNPLVHHSLISLLMEVSVFKAYEKIKKLADDISIFTQKDHKVRMGGPLDF